MLGVIADDHYVAVSLDDLALFADLLNGRLYFHSNNHLSQNLLYYKLLSTPCDSSLCGVVDGNLYCYLITGKDLDIIHSELTGDMSSNDHIVGKLYLEGRIGQSLNYGTLKLDYVILRQNSVPPSIIVRARLL